MFIHLIRIQINTSGFISGTGNIPRYSPIHNRQSIVKKIIFFQKRKNSFLLNERFNIS